jgi:hypothetical protein
MALAPPAVDSPVSAPITPSPVDGAAMSEYELERTLQAVAGGLCSNPGIVGWSPEQIANYAKQITAALVSP